MYSSSEILKQTNGMLLAKWYDNEEDGIRVYPTFPHESEFPIIPIWMLIESCGQAAELWDRISCGLEKSMVNLAKVNAFTCQQRDKITARAITLKPKIISQFGNYVQSEVKGYDGEKEILSTMFIHYFYIEKE